MCQDFVIKCRNVEVGGGGGGFVGRLPTGTKSVVQPVCINVGQL